MRRTNILHAGCGTGTRDIFVGRGVYALSPIGASCRHRRAYRSYPLLLSPSDWRHCASRVALGDDFDPTGIPKSKLGASWVHPWAICLHPFLLPLWLMALCIKWLCLESSLIDKNQQYQCLEPLGGILGFMGCIVSCPSMIGVLVLQCLGLDRF